MATDLSTGTPQNPAGSAPVSRADQFIDRELSQTTRRLRNAEVAWAILVTVAWFLAAFLVAMVFDAWVLPLSAGWRVLMLAVTLTIGAGLFCWTALPPLIRRINPQYVAQMIERSGDTFHNSLLNYLLLRGNRSPARVPVYEAVSHRAARDLAGVEEDQRIDFSRIIRMAVLVAVLVAAFLSYLVFSPRNGWASLARIVAPAARVAPASRVTITAVTPGDAVVFYGERLDVTCEVRGLGREDSVRLLVSSLDGQLHEVAVPMVADPAIANRWKGTLGSAPEGINTGLEYFIEAGDGVSPVYQVSVRPNPTISVQRVDIQPPEYTRLPPVVLTGRGQVRAPEGSRVRITATANQDIKLAWIELVRATHAGTVAANDSDVTVVQSVNMNAVDPRTASGEFQLLLDRGRRNQAFTHYRLRFRNAGDERNELASLHPVEVVPDAAPEVRIVRPEQSEVEIPLNGGLMIEVQASDLDFEISDLQLVLDHRGSRLLDKTLPLPRSGPGQNMTGQTVTGRYRMEPAALGLKAGDEVVFFARAADNRISPHSYAADPNVSVTPSVTARIVAADPNLKPDENKQENPGGADQKTTPPDGQSAPQPEGQGTSGEKPQDGAGNQNRTGEQKGAGAENGAASGKQPPADPAGKTGEKPDPQDSPTGENGATKGPENEPGQPETGTGESGKGQEKTDGSEGAGQPAAEPSAAEDGQPGSGKESEAGKSGENQQPGAGGSGQSQAGGSDSSSSGQASGSGSSAQQPRTGANANGSQSKSSGENAGQNSSQSSAAKSGSSGNQQGAAQSGESGADPQSAGNPSGKGQETGNDASSGNGIDDRSQDPSGGSNGSNNQGAGGETPAGNRPADGMEQKPDNQSNQGADSQGQPGSDPAGNQGSGNSNGGGTRDRSLTSGQQERLDENATDGERFEAVEEFLNQPERGESGQSGSGSQSSPEQSSSGQPQSAAGSSADPSTDQSGKSPGDAASGSGESANSDPAPDQTSGESGQDPSAMRGSDPANNPSDGGSQSAADRSGRSPEGEPEKNSGSGSPRESGTSDSGTGKSGQDRSAAAQPDSGKGAESQSDSPSGSEESATREGAGESGQGSDRQNPAGKEQNAASNPAQAESGAGANARPGESGNKSAGDDQAGEDPSGTQSAGSEKSGGEKSGEESGGKERGEKNPEAGAAETGSDEQGADGQDSGADQKSGSQSQPGAGSEQKSGEPGQAGNNSSPASQGKQGEQQASGGGSASSETPAGGQQGNAPSAQGSGSRGNAASPSGQAAGNAAGGGGASSGGGGVRSGSGPVPLDTAGLTNEEQQQLEYARAATDLLLEKLETQRNQPDRDLLSRLNWTEEQMREFLDRWQKMKAAAESGDEVARKEYTQALRGLGLRKRDPESRRIVMERDEQDGYSEDGAVNRPPADLAPEFNAFMKARAREDRQSGGRR